MRALSVANTELLYTRILWESNCPEGEGHLTFSQTEIECNINECIPPSKNLRESFIIEIPPEEDSPTDGYKWCNCTNASQNTCTYSKYNLYLDEILLTAQGQETYKPSYHRIGPAEMGEKSTYDLLDYSQKAHLLKPVRDRWRK